MYGKKVKKKLRLNKRTISNLDIDQEDVLRDDETRVIAGGSIPIFQVSVTRHPKYCR